MKTHINMYYVHILYILHCQWGGVGGGGGGGWGGMRGRKVAADVSQPEIRHHPPPNMEVGEGGRGGGQLVTPHSLHIHHYSLTFPPLSTRK